MMRPSALACACALLLGGCEAVVLAGLTEHNNYRSHGRSAAGWLATVASQQDCDPWRQIDRKPVCNPEPGPPPVDPVCYKSLAAVTCYDTPDPLMPQGRLLPAPGQTR